MSKNDIVHMSAKERLALMEELWASFERDNLEYPVPAWHEEVLKQRAQKNTSNFIPFEEAKQNVREALDAYRDS